MSHKYHLILLLLALTTTLSAQEIGASFGLQYIYSPELDKAIQRANFSRHYLDETQPLLIYGTYVGGNYQFASDAKFKSGLKLDYGLSRSSVKNADLVVLNFHQLQLGYTAQYSFNEHKNRWILEGDVSFVGTSLSRRIDGEIELIDEEKNRAYGYGFNLGVTVLYCIKEKENSCLQLFLGTTYSPYLNSASAESLIHPTIVVGSDYLRMLTSRFGLRWNWVKKSQ